ncbi:MAG: putative thymidylate kinase [Methanonatronarchaeales archaeon]|nr:putative thymidylate kinase [Methanonatronarchaeales archaeon]
MSDLIDKPFFVVIEGLDGSGKSTQTAELKSWLDDYWNGNNGKRGIAVTREPTQGDIGSLIRDKLGTNGFLKNTFALLFAADRLENIERNIKPELKKGKGLLSDRFVYSTLAYQGAQGADRKWICEINKNIISPDLVVILKLDPEKALERIDTTALRGYSKKEYFEKKLNLLIKINEEYEKMFHQEGEYSKLAGMYPFLDTSFREVDAQGSIREVQNRIRGNVKGLLKGEIPIKDWKHIRFEPEQKFISEY